MRKKIYSEIVYIATILVFTLLLLIGLGCKLSINVFAESIYSASLTTNPETAATYDSVFPFFTSEAISTIMSPVISVVSISFAMSTYLLNNSYNIKNMSVSANTRKLILKSSNTTSWVATILLILLVPLLITNIFKCYIGFYIVLVLIAIVLCYLGHNFILFNRERNVILNFDNNFKESKLIKREEKKRGKKSNKNSDYIFAFIEVCYENKYQGMFKENLKFNHILNLWGESMDKKSVTDESFKLDEKFEFFYNYIDEIFNNKQLDSVYLSNLYVYFLSELEKVIFENDCVFKESNYELMYSVCLSYAFNSVFDVDVIDEFFKSKTSETYIYRWLFYRYILLFEYNRFMNDKSFYKPRFSFLDEMSYRVKSISPYIKDNHIVFLIVSLFLYQNKCLKNIALIFDMNYILDTMKEDLINIDSVI